MAKSDLVRRKALDPLNNASLPSGPQPSTTTMPSYVAADGRHPLVEKNQDAMKITLTNVLIVRDGGIVTEWPYGNEDGRPRRCHHNGNTFDSVAGQNHGPPAMETRGLLSPLALAGLWQRPGDLE